MRVLRPMLVSIRGVSWSSPDRARRGPPSSQDGRAATAAATGLVIAIPAACPTKREVDGWPRRRATPWRGGARALASASP
jgi:hypothetical protein